MPYFVYDIYAMFMCYWHKLRVKGHEDGSAPRDLRTAFSSYLRREFLMVLHHVVMVTVCFPVSVVTVTLEFNEFTLCNLVNIKMCVCVQMCVDVGKESSTFQNRSREICTHTLVCLWIDGWVRLKASL